MKSQFRQRVINELKQTQHITESLIVKILYSKRLLVDHVEALENCMLHIKTAPPSEADGSRQIGHNSRLMVLPMDNVFTARSAVLLLGSVLLERLITPKPLRLTLLPSMILVSGFSAMYVVKNVFVFRNKIVERALDNLIQTIDDFGNCLRRNMTYFNEILIMKQEDLLESQKRERAWDCITAAKEVTEILYDGTRKLETLYPISTRLSQYYLPMEELRECEYFTTNITDYSPKHIKDFYNIFGYVQSQFLLRLALAILTKPSLSKLNSELVKMNCLIRQLVQEEENHFQALAVELKKQKQLEVEALNAAKAMRNCSGPVAVLQDSSLKLSARMVAVAGECQALDITLQRLTEAEAMQSDNAKQFADVANNMRCIENTLSMCCDDFQRLILVYNRFLNSKLDKSIQIRAEHCEPTSEERTESDSRDEISQTDRQATDMHDDDFYAYVFDEKKMQDNPTPNDIDFKRDNDIIEKRITKSKFRPVLKQLKDRIDPIRKELLQKERKILAAKGINIDDLFSETFNDADASEHIVFNNSSDSDGSVDLQYEERAKKLKNRDNFAEMRNWLAQKPALNLYDLDVSQVTIAARDEDVLE